jgi:hypothetical protein
MNHISPKVMEHGVAIFMIILIGIIVGTTCYNMIKKKSGSGQ